MINLNSCYFKLKQKKWIEAFVDLLSIKDKITLQDRRKFIKVAIQYIRPQYTLSYNEKQIFTNITNKLLV